MNCPICYEPVSLGIECPNCKSTYHKECWEEANTTTCPYCREFLFTTANAAEYADALLRREGFYIDKHTWLYSVTNAIQVFKFMSRKHPYGLSILSGEVPFEITEDATRDEYEKVLVTNLISNAGQGIIYPLPFAITEDEFEDIKRTLEIRFEGNLIFVGEIAKLLKEVDSINDIIGHPNHPLFNKLETNLKYMSMRPLPALSIGIIRGDKINRRCSCGSYITDSECPRCGKTCNTNGCLCCGSECIVDILINYQPHRLPLKFRDRCDLKAVYCTSCKKAYYVDRLDKISYIYEVDPSFDVIKDDYDIDKLFMYSNTLRKQLLEYHEVDQKVVDLVASIDTNPYSLTEKLIHELLLDEKEGPYKCLMSNLIVQENKDKIISVINGSNISILNSMFGILKYFNCEPQI